MLITSYFSQYNDLYLPSPFVFKRIIQGDSFSFHPPFFGRKNVKKRFCWNVQVTTKTMLLVSSFCVFLRISSSVTRFLFKWQLSFLQRNSI